MRHFTSVARQWSVILGFSVFRACFVSVRVFVCVSFVAVVVMFSLLLSVFFRWGLLFFVLICSDLLPVFCLVARCFESILSFIGEVNTCYLCTSSKPIKFYFLLCWPRTYSKLHRCPLLFRRVGWSA